MPKKTAPSVVIVYENYNCSLRKAALRARPAAKKKWSTCMLYR